MSHTSFLYKQHMISTSSKPFIEIGLMHVKIVMVFKLLTLQALHELSTCFSFYKHNAYKHIQAQIFRNNNRENNGSIV